MLQAAYELWYYWYSNRLCISGTGSLLTQLGVHIALWSIDKFVQAKRFMLSESEYDLAYYTHILCIILFQLNYFFLPSAYSLQTHCMSCNCLCSQYRYWVLWTILSKSFCLSLCSWVKLHKEMMTRCCRHPDPQKWFETENPKDWDTL